MIPKEKRQLENMLLVMGLKGLRDPELIEELANLISGWPGDKHSFLQDLLNECDTAAQRSEMYRAIAPKLRFKALPLGTYEDRLKERAGAMVSQRKMRVEGDAPKPIEVGERKYIPTTQEEATAALATLTCHKCGKSDRFLADTPIGAMIAGRKAGWIRDPGVNKEVCPSCQQRKVCPECGADMRKIGNTWNCLTNCGCYHEEPVMDSANA